MTKIELSKQNINFEGRKNNDENIIAEDRKIIDGIFTSAVAFNL